MKWYYQKHAFTIALAFIAAANGLLFLYVMEKASIRVPVYDLLDWLQFYGERFQAGDLFGYLWTPHNEHRIVLSRILVALDVRWFAASGGAFVLFGLFLLLAMVAAVCREILKSDLSISWKLTATPIAILLMTPAHTVVMVGMQAMGLFLQTCSFAVCALVLLDGAAEQDHFSNYRRAAALIAACLAAFGVSGGLLIWPVLMWLAWRGDLGWRWIAGIACVGGLFIAVYLWQLPSPPVSTSLTFGHAVRSLDYAIRLLGLPWSHKPEFVWPARVIGLSILCLGGFALVRDNFWSRCRTRLQRLGLAFILFSLLLAAAAALARADVAVDRAMPIRYGMFAVLAHVGLLLWSLPFLEQLWHGAHRRAFQSAILAISIAWFGQQVVVGRLAIDEADRYRDAWSRFVAGHWTPDMLHYVYPDRDRARASLTYLRQMGLYR
jgi:hypothetical protein